MIDWPSGAISELESGARPTDLPEDAGATDTWADPTGELIGELSRLGSEIGALRRELSAMRERLGPATRPDDAAARIAPPTLLGDRSLRFVRL